VFGERLKEEFEARKRSNSRYSLRAFATFLGADHSTVSQVLRGTRRATPAQVRGWARKLGIPAEEISVLLAAAQSPDPATAKRQAMLMHWTAEAQAVVRDELHHSILRLCGRDDFRPDSRWIAQHAGVAVDDVNIALQRLLRLGLLELSGSGRWRDCLGLGRATAREFRRAALTRVREKAAEDRITIGKDKTKSGQSRNAVSDHL
jgi:transcriptional regulator with XRE-family HTH domain